MFSFSYFGQKLRYSAFMRVLVVNAYIKSGKKKSSSPQIIGEAESRMSEQLPY